MLVIVAPGQGAQTPGFLTPWLEDRTFASRIEWLATVAGLDLVHYGTEADAETIRDTQIAQPLLVATGLVAALELFPHPADAFTQIGAVAGHSVGELTAAAGARVITAEQAMVLVRERGNAMAEAAAVTPTGMTAVLGGDRDEVLAALDKHGLTAANDNGPGQIVAAGTLEQLEALAADPPRQGPADAAQRGRRVPHRPHGPRRRPPRRARPVGVGPRPAHPADLQQGRPRRPRRPGRARPDRRPDRQPGPLGPLPRDHGATSASPGILEMPPAGTLTGIAKRALKGVETFALKTPDQLDEARAFVQTHGEASPMDTSPTWRMVVSPGQGHLPPVAEDAAARDVLAPAPRSATWPACATAPASSPSHGGQVVEWLVEDGDLVSPGQPLLRLHPEGAS